MAEFMNIKTERSWRTGWYAYLEDSYDGPESPCGFGWTEQDAIDDLKERVEE